MSEIKNYIQMLSTSFFSEVHIPSELLANPTVQEYIRNYRWSVTQSTESGWSRLVRNITYNN